jgi:hypothetical protein
VANFAMMLHQRGESPELLARIAGDNSDNDDILPEDLQREFGVKTGTELTAFLEDQESRYEEEDPDDDEMIGNGVTITFAGGGPKTTYNGKE